MPQPEHPPVNDVPYQASFAAVDPQLATAVTAFDLAGMRIALQDIKLITLPAGWTSGIHRHHYYEVDMILDGHGETAMLPQQRLGPGTVLYHPPDIPHAWQVSAGTCQVFSLGFAIAPALEVQLPPHWPVQLDLVAEVQVWLADMRQEAPGWRDRVTLRVGIILSRFLALMTAHTTQLPAANRMALLDRYLCDHLADPLSLDDIAEYLCVSRRTLTRLVATHTGSTVMARLQTFRLLRAAELLWQTDHALATVAEKAGIPHLSYFCRCFRRHFGVTPMQYRRQAH